MKHNQYFFIFMVIFSLFLWSDRVERRSQAQGNCPDCRPGEKALTIIKTVGPGDYVYSADPACKQDMDLLLNRSLAPLKVKKIPGLNNFSGPIFNSSASRLNEIIKNRIGGDFGQMLAPYTGPKANCVLFETMIPNKAEIKAFRLEAYEQNQQGGKCQPGVDCGIGWCKWSMFPREIRVADGRWIYAIFKNWSHNRTRIAKLTIYYVYEGPEIR